MPDRPTRNGASVLALAFFAGAVLTSCLAPSAAAQQVSTPPGAAASPIDVQAVDRSEPTLCAENDNVHIDFVSPDVGSFTIRSVHPAYIGAIATEKPGFDLTSCAMDRNPVYPTSPTRKTFAETPKFWLTGYTIPGFWRPNSVPIRVGKETYHFHMIQVWMVHRERAEEILVFYPPDGYWRARPLPYADLRWTAYGTSFLVGPVEQIGRPLVRYKSIDFDPASRSFTLSFERGGAATLRLAAVDQKQILLNVALGGSLDRTLPFAALRSMYVTETNSDVARVAWRSLNGSKWFERPVLGFGAVSANKFWAGRRLPSRHNLSAPDFALEGFAATRRP
ncbi:MAG: hypothetical protein AB7F96_21975 [Beijerinckiaceae bacterium]